LSSMIRPTIILFVLLTVLTGFMYPLVITAIARAAFPEQAEGSLILRGGKPIGSRLIGQNFSDPKYFWSRPSATSPQAYNGTASGGSNLGPLNPALTDAIKVRIQALQSADPGNTVAVPVDLVSASASGLDPHVSVAAARYQVARVARMRGLSAAAVQTLLSNYSEGRLWGFVGEPRVNVLELNLALDQLAARAAKQ
jgi:K+-transporting ATPase ATPase C chain